LQQALTQLDQAEAIYRSDERHDKRQLAKVFLVRASVYQAVGEPVEACAQIERALDIALALDNNVLMAEAKRLQAECSDDPTERLDLARQAGSYAKQTDDERLHDRIEQSLRQAQERQLSSADEQRE
jgi:hypothetical protein